MIVVSNSSFICTVGQKKKWNPPINSNKNQRRELKLVPINMDYCLLQFHALKFVLEVRLHGGSPPNSDFFNVKFFQRNPKVHCSN